MRSDCITLSVLVLQMCVKDEIAVTSMKWILMANISRYLFPRMSLLELVTYFKMLEMIS